jgi:hypothetical protein
MEESKAPARKYQAQKHDTAIICFWYLALWNSQMHFVYNLSLIQVRGSHIKDIVRQNLFDDYYLDVACVFIRWTFTVQLQHGADFWASGVSPILLNIPKKISVSLSPNLL